MYYVSTHIEKASGFVEHIVRVHLGVWVPALSLQDDLPGTPQGRRTRYTVQVRLGVGIPTLQCGYTCPVASLVDHLVVKVWVSLHQGVPAQYALQNLMLSQYG